MRSWLFVPADAETKLRKALAGEADAVIVDLEDSVPGEGKDSAREAASALVTELAGKTRAAVYLRVNERSSLWFEADVRAAARAPFAGVVLPKSETAEDVRVAAGALDIAEAEIVRQSPLDLVPLIESAAGVLNARELLAASPRVRRATFGVMDFLLDIGGRLSADGSESLFALSYIALASRAEGKEPPVDTVYPAFRDAEGFEAAAMRARCLGYSGKLLIHPSQIEAANRLFAPSPEELDFSRRVVTAYEAALAEGKAAIKVDGKMVDIPVYRRARNVLRQAESYGLGEAERA